MKVEPRKTGRSSGAVPLIVAALLLVLALLLVRLCAHGIAFRRPGAAAAAMLPGLTIDEGGGHRPVVTSLRTGSEAERLGVQVGDRIVAIDDRPVASLAAVRTALDRHHAGPLALHLRRGDALLDVALAGATAPDRAAADEAHEPQDPAD